jgi:hypothetical protein
LTPAEIIFRVLSIIHLRTTETSLFESSTVPYGVCGSVVVEPLCYKPEGEWIFFNLPNPSGHTEPLTELSTRNRKIMFLGRRERPVRKADNLTAIYELDIVGSSTYHDSIGLLCLISKFSLTLVAAPTDLYQTMFYTVYVIYPSLETLGISYCNS